MTISIQLSTMQNLIILPRLVVVATVNQNSCIFFDGILMECEHLLPAISACMHMVTCMYVSMYIIRIVGLVLSVLCRGRKGEEGHITNKGKVCD